MIVIDMLQQFKQGYKRRWELIFNRINLKKNTEFDFRDVTVDLPANLPANEDEVIDMWLKLRGLASDETITERLPLGLDYTSERNKIDKQNQENIENNIGNMQKNSMKNKEYEVGDADNVGETRQPNEKTETSIPKAKQKDTVKTPRDI